jgi:hypothetical protein
VGTPFAAAWFLTSGKAASNKKAPQYCEAFCDRVRILTIILYNCNSIL